MNNSRLSTQHNVKHDVTTVCVLQCVAVCYSDMLSRWCVCCGVLQCAAVTCRRNGVYVAVCCSVLQCI